MSKVMNECYCRDCGATVDTEHSEYQCPKCASLDVFNSSFVICSCGERIYLPKGLGVEECWECGKLYNAFGQELASPEEWDEEDRYATFGPQNEYEEVW